MQSLGIFRDTGKCFARSAGSVFASIPGRHIAIAHNLSSLQRLANAVGHTRSHANPDSWEGCKPGHRIPPRRRDLSCVRRYLLQEWQPAGLPEAIAERGQDFWRSGAMDPCIVTADEVPDWWARADDGAAMPAGDAAQFTPPVPVRAVACR